MGTGEAWKAAYQAWVAEEPFGTIEHRMGFGNSAPFRAGYLAASPPATGGGWTDEQVEAMARAHWQRQIVQTGWDDAAFRPWPSLCRLPQPPLRKRKRDG